MRTLTGFIFHILFFSVSSASMFMVSNIIYPVRTVQDRPPVQMPRMTLNFSEFSPAFAALEDDYYLADYEEEQIPKDVESTALRPPTKEIIKSEIPEIQIPQMTLRATDSIDTMMNVSGVALKEINPTDAEKPVEKTAVATLAEQKKNGLIGMGTHFWIQGKIELTEGLAISDPRDTLAVGWFENSERKKEGRISLREGIYEIKVDRLEGEIIAELADRHGLLMGEAIIDLDVLAKTRGNPGMIIGGVDIKIRPYNFSFKGQTISVYDSPSNKQGVGRSQVDVGEHDLHVRSDDKGDFVEPVLSAQSTGVVTAQQAKYRQTVMLANFDRELRIHLFPDQFMHSFFETINLPKKHRTDGVIWGTIARDHQPAQGYQVRIAGQQNAKPTYFQMYIAHPSSDKTSPDGQFAFVGLNDGEYEVEVVDPLGRLVDTKLAVVRAGTINELNFEIGDEREFRVRPFDPLSMQPKNIEFFALGQNGVQQVKTEDILKMKSYPGPEPLLIYTKVEGADVESATFASRHKKFQEIPVLNDSWWKGIQKSYNISVSNGAVVGFVDTDKPFEVYIDHQSEQTKLLYLDQQGRTINKTANMKASGFVIYNIEHGIHTLIIESEHGQITSEAVYVDGEAISLVYKAI
jgi:hypothetical protein